MVADLLECGDQGQHETPPLHAFRGADPAHRLVDRRLVERGLLAGQGAEDLHLLLGRQVLDDRRVALEPSQDEGSDEAPEAFGDVVPAVPLDGGRHLAAEGLERPEEARIEILGDRPELGQPVLDRGARQSDAESGAKGACGPRRVRRGILDVLRFVECGDRPVHARQHGGVAAQQTVGCDDQRAGRACRDLPGRPRAVGPVVANDG
jgi:hypothetical protein